MRRLFFRNTFTFYLCLFYFLVRSWLENEITWEESAVWSCESVLSFYVLKFGSHTRRNKIFSFNFRQFDWCNVSKFTPLILNLKLKRRYTLTISENGGIARNDSVDCSRSTLLPSLRHMHILHILFTFTMCGSFFISVVIPRSCMTILVNLSYF